MLITVEPFAYHVNKTDLKTGQTLEKYFPNSFFSCLLVVVPVFNL